MDRCINTDSTLKTEIQRINEIDSTYIWVPLKDIKEKEIFMSSYAIHNNMLRAFEGDWDLFYGETKVLYEEFINDPGAKKNYTDLKKLHFYEPIYYGTLRVLYNRLHDMAQKHK